MPLRRAALHAAKLLVADAARAHGIVPQLLPVEAPAGDEEISASEKEATTESRSRR